MLKVARFISPLYPFNIWDSMYVLLQQTGNCNVTIVVLRISLFGAAIYSNLLKERPATSGDPLMRKKKNTKPISKQGKCTEERNTAELEPRKTRKHKLPNWFSATMSSPKGSSYCKQNYLGHNQQKTVRYEKFESKGCSNHLTKPLTGPLQRAMILVENSSNQLYAAGEELCKPQLRQSIKENDPNHFHELSNMICSIQKLSLTLN